MFCRRLILTAIITLSLAVSVDAEKLGNARVKGVLYDHDVKLSSARYENRILEIYEGDSWAGHQSLLVFLFDKEVAPGKSIRVKPKSDAMQPHVHSRYQTKSGIVSEVVMGDYEMTIRFGKKFKRGYLPATFKLEMLDEDARTELNGFFFLRQSDLTTKKTK